MRLTSDQLTYGIEEEYFLVDPATGALIDDAPEAFLRASRARFGARVCEELHRAQVEVATPILATADDARREVTLLRAGLGEEAARAGLGLVASGTHPLACWSDQAHTDKPRYDHLVDDYQMVGRRNLLCGLHVHVGIPDGVDRVALMNRLMPWVPLFLALSASSPFWNGRRTGLMSYRQAAYDEWPRSGIPDAFTDEAEYGAFVELLTRSGAVRDGSFLWWAVRPSATFPTLELRISDACPRVDDALAIAAAFRCLVRAHLRRPDLGATWSNLTRRVVDENRWRAKRYGSEATFLAEGEDALVPLAALLDRFAALVAPDARALGCEREIAHLRAIPRLGTGAHLQLRTYAREREHGRPREDALRRVVDALARATLAMDLPRATRRTTEARGIKV